MRESNKRIMINKNELSQMIYNITSIKEEYKEKEHKIADELNKSKEELNFKNQQIEVTEKILKESRDLLGNFYL